MKFQLVEAKNLDFFLFNYNKYHDKKNTKIYLES